KILSGKTIPRPGQEEHRLLDPVEVLIPQLVSLAYRMERITEEEESVHVYPVGCYLGRDSSSHGFSSYDHSIWLMCAVLCLVDDCAVAFLQDLSPVRHPPAGFHVGKIEPDSQEASLCEFSVEISYEGRGRWSPGAAGYDDACRWIVDRGWLTVVNAWLSTSCKFDLDSLKLSCGV